MKASISRWSPALTALCLLLMVAPVSVQAQQPDAALTTRLDRIEHEVSTVRQLPLKAPIHLEFKTRDDLKREVTQDLANQYTTADQARDERVLAAFGFIPAGTDLLKIQQNVQGEQIAGYYDSHTDQMVVVRSSDNTSSFSALDEITFAHEVTHALQDQNFNLDGLLRQQGSALDDQSLALLALVEGDATSCQVDYLLANKSLIPALAAQVADPDFSSDQLDKAPAYIRQTLLFPYDQGSTFVDALKQNGGWAKVDSAYQRPPVSTEQILHPEKYLADEQPVPVTIPDLGPTLGSGWMPVETNDLGELGIRILLSGQSNSKEQANRDAAGWGGDRYEAWGKGDQTALVWRSTWDTGSDATQFAAGLGAYEAQRWKVDADSSVASGEQWFISPTAVTVVIQQGEQVHYVLAPDRATAQRIVDVLV